MDLENQSILQIEDIKLELVAELEVIDFSDSVKLLYHSQDRNFKATMTWAETTKATSVTHDEFESS